ncbi:DUF6625 family protein [Paramuribaculum intestinale]|uniref:DUF6625 family protein n=1 Tax=Paramuribaculum intestinale TaxID=2094151 RepID=UPI00338DCAC5
MPCHGLANCHHTGGYIESCADNSDIDFLIVTDQAVGAVPDNVRVISMSWNQISEIQNIVFKFGI